MGLKIPDRAGVVSSMQSYVRANCPELDPSVTNRRGFIGGMVKSVASALHDFYVKLKRYADYEPHPQTATEDFFTTGWWIDITKLDRKAESAATGSVAITGTAGSVLPAATVLTAGSDTYTVDNSASIVSQSLNVASLSRDGATAIVETTGEHFLATGISVVISGATEADYNGTFEITATAANEFTYSLGDLTPTTPATGTPIVTATWGVVDLTATSHGLGPNRDHGTAFAVASPPSGVDDQATATYGGVNGGSAREDIEDWRERVLEALGTDFGMFSPSEIKIVAAQVPGVTRVFVRRATLDGTNGVYEGQVKVHFMRDNDANPFPSAQEVATVKTHVVDTILPAHMSPDDAIFASPARLDVPFAFTAISPDTGSMRLAITAALKQFFSEEIVFAEDIEEDAYRCAIKDTYDSERNQALKSFTLSTPSGNITVADDEMPVLGTVSFPS